MHKVLNVLQTGTINGGFFMLNVANFSFPHILFSSENEAQSSSDSDSDSRSISSLTQEVWDSVLCVLSANDSNIYVLMW